MTEQPEAPTGRHPVVAYTALRVLIFAVPFGLLLLFGVDLVWALLIVALLSSLASVFVLSRQRDQMSMALTGRSERIRQRMAEREASEDEWDDARRSAADDATSGPSDSTGSTDPSGRS